VTKRVLIPLPARDFDITEVAVPWSMLREAGHDVVFCTESGGARPAADPLLITGVVFGALGAHKEPLAFYDALQSDPAFESPLAWPELDATDFDGLILPGGHAKGMRPYLESVSLRSFVAAFWALGRPVGAICHGPIVLARTIDPATGESVLRDRKTTCLPKYMERLAFYLTAWRRGRYYRTYATYVEDEVRGVLADPREQYERGPTNLGKRGTADDDTPAMVVEDGNYLSARWPGDAYLFSRRFAEML